MTEENKKKSEDQSEEKVNKFEQEQPIRHPLADVVQDGKSIKINEQLYSIIVNERDALDIETLRKKYDPYLDQYDYLVGDVSSDHLRLKGFYKDNGTLYAVVRQEYIKADTPTSLEEVKTFMKLNGFINIRNNDYHNPELGIILEDLHDENVLTRNGSLFFIDTVFYIEPSFWQIEKIDKIL